MTASNQRAPDDRGRPVDQPAATRRGRSSALSSRRSRCTTESPCSASRHAGREPLEPPGGPRRRRTPSVAQPAPAVRVARPARPRSGPSRTPAGASGSAATASSTAAVSADGRRVRDAGRRSPPRRARTRAPRPPRRAGAGAAPPPSSREHRRLPAVHRDGPVVHAGVGGLHERAPAIRRRHEVRGARRPAARAGSRSTRPATRGSPPRRSRTSAGSCCQVGSGRSRLVIASSLAGTDPALATLGLCRKEGGRT